MTQPQKHLVYWAGPLVVSLVMVYMNFSGIPALANIISPAINREFGLLENLQLLTILLIGYFAIRGIARKTWKLEKVALIGLAAFSLLIFLEEIDYGLHYREYFFGDGTEDKSIVRNLHNQGDNNNIIKQVVYSLMALLFFVAPIVGPRIRHPLVRYVTPDRFLIASVLVYIAVGQVVRHVRWPGWTENESLRGNLSEFDEALIYYLFLLYVVELVYRKFGPFDPVEEA